jgi:tetratricopeptide (TPR) repeat protein
MGSFPDTCTQTDSEKERNTCTSVGGKSSAALVLSDPDSAVATSFANLGLAFQLLHRTHDAMLCYSSAAEYWQLAGKRLTPTLLYNWGLCHLSVKEIAQGRTQLQGVLEMDPSHMLAHYTLAKRDRAEGALEAAMQHLRNCVDGTPNLLRRLWKGWWRLGQLERLAYGAKAAIARYQSVWECMGTKAHAVCGYLALELCLEVLADPDDMCTRDKAFKLLNACEETVVHRRSSSWLICYARALLLESTSDDVGANRLWANAEQLSALGARCHGALGDLLSAYGDVELALQCYRRELSATETTPPRHVRLERRISNALSGHSSLSGSFAITTDGSWQSIAAAYVQLQLEECQYAYMPNLLY